MGSFFSPVTRSTSQSAPLVTRGDVVDCLRSLLVVVPAGLIDLFAWPEEFLLEVKGLLSRRGFEPSGFSRSRLDFGLLWREDVGLLSLEDLKGIIKRESEPLFFGDPSDERPLSDRALPIVVVLGRSDIKRRPLDIEVYVD